MSHEVQRLIIHLWLAGWDIESIASWLGYVPSHIAAVVQQYEGETTCTGQK